MSNVRKFAALVRRHVGTPEIVFEFGARDCNETVAISREFPQARIYSFECNRATLPVCRERAAGHPMISLVECAVGDRDGKAIFHPIDPQKTVTTWADGNPGASSLFVASGKYEVETYVQGSEEVGIVRPDTFMAKHGLPRVDALWMDIQGAELMALQGFGNRISDLGLVSLEAEFIEIYKDQPLFREIHDYLRDRGFLLTGFLNLGAFSCDAVFVRHEHPGMFPKVRASLLLWYARFMVGTCYPLRKAVGAILRKTGLKK